MNKTLYLIRGVPGSGKTTMAEYIGDAVVYAAGSWGEIIPMARFEADQFFETDTGYKWAQDRLGDAHIWCQSQARNAMETGIPNVLVSNTFIKQWTLEPYRSLARVYDYTVFEIVCRGSFQNIHGVPDDKVEAMRRAFEY